MKSIMNSGMTHLASPCNVTNRSKNRPLTKLFCWSALLLIVVGLSACEPTGELLAEPQYAAALVGDWQGEVGNERETMSFQTGGGFTATLFPTGFIGSTLGQGTTGIIRGTWVLQGKVITLAVKSAQNQQPLNLATTSTIVTFNQNKLVIKSDRGETSTFIRAD